METAPNPSAQNPNETNGDVRSIGSAVLEKHVNPAGTEKRGRGRPSNAEKAARASVSPVSPGAPGQTGLPQPIATIDLKAVSESFQNLFKSFDLWMVKRDERKIIMLTGDEKLARTITDEIRTNDTEAKSIGDNFALCCQTYGWLGQHFPLVALSLGIAGYTAKRISGQTTINQIAAHVKKARTNANISQPVQADNHGEKRDGENVSRA